MALPNAPLVRTDAYHYDVGQDIGATYQDGDGGLVGGVVNIPAGFDDVAYRGGLLAGNTIELYPTGPGNGAAYYYASAHLPYGDLLDLDAAGPPFASWALVAPDAPTGFSGNSGVSGFRVFAQRTGRHVYSIFTNFADSTVDHQQYIIRSSAIGGAGSWRHVGFRGVGGPAPLINVTDTTQAFVTDTSPPQVWLTEDKGSDVSDAVYVLGGIQDLGPEGQAANTAGGVLDWGQQEVGIFNGGPNQPAGPDGSGRGWTKRDLGGGLYTQHAGGWANLYPTRPDKLNQPSLDSTDFCLIQPWSSPTYPEMWFFVPVVDGWDIYRSLWLPGEWKPYGPAVFRTSMGNPVESNPSNYAFDHISMDGGGVGVSPWYTPSRKVGHLPAISGLPVATTHIRVTRDYSVEGRLWLLVTQSNGNSTSPWNKCWWTSSWDDGATWAAFKQLAPSVVAPYLSPGNVPGMRAPNVCHTQRGDLIAGISVQAKVGERTGTSNVHTNWLLRVASSGGGWAVGRIAF